MTFDPGITEGVIGTLVIVGGTVGTLSKWGMVKFGKNGNGAGKCPDSSCHDIVVGTATAVASIAKRQEAIEKTLQQLCKDVAFIRGRMD